MIGWPSRVKPVFICDSAGPCVLALADMEWMKQRSSTKAPVSGRRSLVIFPDLPRGLKA